MLVRGLGKAAIRSPVAAITGAQLAAGVTVVLITSRQVKHPRPRYGPLPPNYPTNW